MTTPEKFDLAKEFKNVRQQWSFNGMFGHILMHLGAAFVIFLLVWNGFPKFSTLSWVLLGLFGALGMGGVATLAITTGLFRLSRKRAVEYAQMAGLLLLSAGIVGLLAVLIIHGFDAFPVGAWVLWGIFCITTVLGITIGYHRYATHRAFKVGKVFGRVMLFCGAKALQWNVRQWAEEHMIHHTRTEIEAQDPHTPREGFWHSHILWIWHQYVYPEKIRNIFGRRLDANPLIVEQKKYYPYAVAFGMVFPFVLFGLWGLWSSGEFSLLHGCIEGLKAFLLAGLFRIVIVYHITFSVNSISHFAGPQPYENEHTGDSRDVWMLAPLSAGENLQNIHHLVPSVAYYDVNWYYKIIDTSGWIITSLAWCNRFSWLAWLGLPYDVKRIDGATLEYINRHTIKKK